MLASSLLPYISLLLGINLSYFTLSDSPNTFPDQSYLPINWAPAHTSGMRIGQYSADHAQFGDGNYNFVDIAADFAIYQGPRWELGGSGGVFTQFRQQDGSFADRVLLNSDYQIGNYLAYRIDNNWVGRIKLNHKSSHLGDEYLYTQNSGGDELVLADYNEDQIELLLGRSSANAYGYIRYNQSVFGQSFADTTKSDNLFEQQRNLSLAYQRSWRLSSSSLALLGAFEGTIYDQREPGSGLSLKLGLEKKSSQRPRFAALLALEYYHGPSEFSEFINSEVEYYGLSYSLHF